MHSLLYLCPLFLGFEVWQLVVAERFLGIARIEQGVDPRRLPMRLRVSVPWVLGVLASWLWVVLLLTDPLGRIPALCMAVVGGFGYFLRRSAPMRWVLVILTFEGAIRIGMMLFMMGLLWRSR